MKVFSLMLSDSGWLVLLSMSDLFLFEWNVLFDFKWSVLIGWVCGNISVWDRPKTITTDLFFLVVVRFGFFYFVPCCLLNKKKQTKKPIICMFSVLTSAAEELSRIMPLFEPENKCEMWSKSKQAQRNNQDREDRVVCCFRCISFFLTNLNSN